MKIKQKLDNKTLEKRSNLFKNLLYKKKDFVKRYGKDAEKVMKGRATNVAKKQVFAQKLKEAIKKVLNEQRRTKK